MLVSSSAWSTTFLVLSTLLTLGCSQRCGGSIEAGAGVIRSSNYPDGYPASDCVWIIHSGAETRIRIKFQARDCSGDSLWIYDGNGTVGVPLLGQYCSTVPPTSIDSSGRLVTIKFISVGGAENNQGFVISYESNGTPPSCNPNLVFLEEPQNVEVVEGDLLEPRCRVSDQDATLTWFKDGQMLDSGAVNGIFVDQLNQLIIPSFDARHAGHYSCVVFSGDRECIRSEANITFNHRSYFNIVPVNAYVNIGDSHQFLCSPIENTWSVVWEKYGQPLEQGNLFILRGNLYLIDIMEENEGKYTCVARDEFGRTKGRVHAWLYLTDPPQIDISTVCGTITYWKENNAQTTPSPAVDAHTEVAGIAESSIDWSSESIKEAGRSSGRVTGGNIANHGSAPYMVRIWEKRTEYRKPWTFICGATLLDQRWILTAAQCMYDKHGNLIQQENMNLFFGDYDSDVREESEKSRQPAEMIVHEDYDKTNYDNDIALIRIDPPLWEFTPYIRPICLAPEVLASRLMDTNINGRVTGWGQGSFGSQTSRFMKEVELPIVDRQTCEESIDEDEAEFTDNMFCAGYHSALYDACKGDSGGPFAFRHDDGRWYQVGIVSWGVGCAAEGEYGFYTSVSRYIHWLRSKNVTVAFSPNVGMRFNESQRSEALAFTVRSPSNLTVAAGSVVDLECVPNRDDASVQWFIGNSIRPVRYFMDGVRILPSGLVLHFDAMEDHFSGVYSCEARVNDEEGEQVIRANFQLSLNPLSWFEFVPVDAYVNIGDVHQFQCSPIENTWSVIWEKDGQPLEQGNFRILRGSLYLIDIREENEGRYTCAARDQFGRTKGRVHAWLYLTDPPQIDISTVCGTITYWKDSNAQTTPSPAVDAHTEVAGIAESSIDWSSESIKEAGRSSGRVVGGNIAKHGSAPYMVRIWEKRTEYWKPWTFICGATLLDQRWILTAAHCMFDKHRNLIQKENMNLFFGDYDSDVREESEESRQPAEMIVHEDYDDTNYDNNIALIRIDPPLWEFTPYIRPICLAPGRLARRFMDTNINGRVTGWGREALNGPTNRFMKEVELPIVDRQTCDESVDENEGEFTDNMFCAGYHSALHDACSGDSGGPFAVRHDDGRWYQVGIVSWGVGCAAEGEYGFYTHVSRYLHWLRSKNVTVAYSPNVERWFEERQRSEALAFTVRSPSILTVAAGSVVDLECVPNRDDASVQWFAGSSIRPVRYFVEGVRILPSGLVLHFDAMEDDFSGIYSCEARVNDEEEEQVIRANFQLQMVEEPPEGECSSELAFRETPEDFSPVQNDLVQQSCSTNSPQADITWYKDGVRLMTGSVDGIYILPSNDLLISGFDTHHQGHYACVASFSGRECLRVEVDFEMVEEPPEGECSSELAFQETPEDFSPVQNDLVQQSCSTNSPQADITWYKDGVRLMTGSVNGIYILPSNDLLIPGFDMHHQGHYACVASFSGRECLRVEVDFEMVEEPPEGECSSELAFQETPEDFSPVQNDLVQQSCSTNSPQADITWYKDGVRLMTGSADGIYILPSNDLLIPGFDTHHQGHYACVASLSGRECLRVEVDFAFDPYRHFEAVPANASLDVGDHHLFECQAQSAIDSVAWWKDGSRVSLTDQIILISGASLLIKNLVRQDSGKYTCIVSDQRGNQRGEAHAWLTVTDTMNPPTINITEVCGTVTSPEATIFTTAAPREGRVVGGQQSLPGSAPYMGRIWHKADRTFICGAALLNQRWVLTAAHCIALFQLQFRDILLYFGDHDTLMTEDHQVIVEVDQIIQHENFDEESFDKDIALFRLKQPFAEFTDYIRPICLPPAWLAKMLLQTDMMGRVTGWGQIAEGGPYPRYLTEVELPVVKTKKCKDATAFEVTRYMFCAGYASAEEKKDACQGDSGGPFAMRHENRWYQLGIVSWGEGCARAGKYGYYTKIFRLHSWIKRNIS